MLVNLQRTVEKGMKDGDMAPDNQNVKEYCSNLIACSCIAYKEFEKITEDLIIKPTRPRDQNMDWSYRRDITLEKDAKVI